MTVRAIIVDDEPLALDLLSAILADIDDIELIATCQSGQDAVKAVLDYGPDVMFLDIQMPEMNGFDVIAAIQADIMPMVIFTTAYAEYAVNAFKVQAIDYVLKPLDEKNIGESVMRARTLIETGGLNRKKPELLSVLQDISKEVQSDIAQKQPRTLIVKESDRIALLEMETIDWLEAAGDYVCIHCDGSTRIMRTTLKSIEAKLRGNQFQRIHRSTVINMHNIKEIIPQKKGEAMVLMTDGSRLKASRLYGNQLREKLSELRS